MKIVFDLITTEFVIWVIAAIVLAIWTAYYLRKPLSFHDKHVFVTGGSGGIGKAIATEVIKEGGRVSLFARGQYGLEDAKNEIVLKTNCNPNSIQIFPGDVNDSLGTLTKIIDDSEKNHGPIFMLVNTAGYAVAGRFEDLSVDNFKAMMSVNFMGTVSVSKVVVPRMKNRGEGVVVLFGSQAGLTGIFGYTAYAATKFALRGFAEALSMEVKPYNISVTLACPPDTDTPGLIMENKTKPKETCLISDSSGVLPAQDVAKQTLEDAKMKRFLSTNGFEGKILTTVCCGMAPITSYFELAIQVLFAGICRAVSAFYLIRFDNIVKAEKNKSEQSKRK
ncbi:3-ketodihydrosphingosine reductase-like isoform X2 [Artemia franciscana]|uniref:3-ketodihydrosphingosine reductase-like isoform X2 n=1 Tax=Artemia franciscana TaxID=6661 RepID=UPI0032DB27EC